MVIVAALLFSLTIPALGHYYLGPFYAILFLIGYLGGFLAWLIARAQPSWESIRIPYWTTMGAFLLLHKVEENRTAFFEVVSEKITGDTVPEVTVGLVLGLLILPIVSWLVIPALVRRGSGLRLLPRVDTLCVDGRHRAGALRVADSGERAVRLFPGHG